MIPPQQGLGLWRFFVVLWLCCYPTVTEGQAVVTPPPTTEPKPVIWGYQQGAANGHTDAGGMVYDRERDEIIMVGTTHDSQFFHHDLANSVDCFIVTIALPDVTLELDAKELNQVEEAMAELAEKERTPWQLNGKHRIATSNELDRCDLITYIEAKRGQNDHSHIFIGGTYATSQNATSRDATSVAPMVYEAQLQHFMTQAGGDQENEISTSDPFQIFAAEEINPGGSPSLTIPKKDIVIPAMMTSHNHELYFANIHRVLVLPRDEVGDPNATPKLQISLGISKFTVTDDDSNPLEKEWQRIEPTNILEVKADSSFMMTGMFNAGDGPAPIGTELQKLQKEQSTIESEMQELETEEELYEEENMMVDLHRHEYTNDGVLVSGLEFVEMSDTESYLLIAGSAPGTKEATGTNANHSATDVHPFMPQAPDHTTYVGDWDGYVAKLNPRTGALAEINTDINSWGYRLSTQPKRNDFIQSICVPKIPNGILLPANKKYYPKVVYAVGTTQGKLDGDMYGGAFMVQIDLVSMDILWKRQLPGMNIHGMACEVFVNIATYATTTRSESKDLIYMAGEVHGNVQVRLADGTRIITHGYGETDVFVAQFRASDGEVNWVQQVGSDQQDRLAKNVNNPSVSDGDQENDIGDTGSGKGGLVLDRHGNAIIFGTTNGSLGRIKAPGDRNRDIFVVRLHMDDGSYKAVLEPHTYVSGPGTSSVNTPSPAPIASVVGNGGSSLDSVSSVSSTGNAQQTTPTHGGATKDVDSVNMGILIAGLAVPLALGLIIILATNNGQSSSPSPVELQEDSEWGATDLHVPFPSRDPSPAPPAVEESLEMSPRRQAPTPSFGSV